MDKPFLPIWITSFVLVIFWWLFVSFFGHFLYHFLAIFFIIFWSLFLAIFNGKIDFFYPQTMMKKMSNKWQKNGKKNDKRMAKTMTTKWQKKWQKNGKKNDKKMAKQMTKKWQKNTFLLLSPLRPRRLLLLVLLLNFEGESAKQPIQGRITK